MEKLECQMPIDEVTTMQKGFSIVPMIHFFFSELQNFGSIMELL